MFRGAVIRLLLYFLRGDDNVVTVYTTLIVKGYKSFNQVPVNLQPGVKDELEALGLGTDGKPLAA
jgi:hypothetical protein